MAGLGEVKMTTTQVLLLALTVVVGVLYLMKRRARLRKED